MKQKSDSNEYFNIWRVLFLVGIVIILFMVFYTTTQEEEIISTYEYDDVLENPRSYINQYTTTIEDYVGDALNINMSVETKDLNTNNAYTLYRYVRRHFTFGEARHLVEVLEQESGSLLGLHSLLASMYKTLDNSTHVYLLLTSYSGKNSTAVLTAIDGILSYHDLSLNETTNTSFDIPINYLSIQQTFNLEDFRVLYAVGPWMQVSFETNIDFYIWINQLHKISKGD